ncbi:hypothetical protein BH09PLA1_BH09PLA1_07760 [soil metagenome]
MNLFCNTNTGNYSDMNATQQFTDRMESRPPNRVAPSRPDVVPLPLADGDLASFGDCSPVQIRATKGQLWITQEGDARDVIVRPGMSFLSARRGKLVVQALEPSVIEVRRLCEG